MEKNLNIKSSNKVKGVKDDQFIYLKDELTAIREAKTMYVSAMENVAAMHLFKEIFNNSLDEINNPASPANKIDIEFYESECRFVVTDNGRGIPLDVLKDAILKKHFSTKFTNLSDSRNKKISGLNGVGITVVAALTDLLSITSYRYTDKKTITLIDGEVKEGKVESIGKKEIHGLSTTFIPSEKYLGEIDLKTDEVADYIRRMSYIIPENVSLNFTYEIPDPKGKKHKIAYKTDTYKSQGLLANIEYISQDLEFSPIQLKVQTDEFDIEIAFSYNKVNDDSIIESYANYIVTTEKGTHEYAAIKAISEFFTKEAKIIEPNSKYEIIPDDCKKGLILIVSLWHIKPVFEGQHKTKVSNKELLTIGKNKLVDALTEFFGNNQTQFKKMISYFRQMSRIRQESHKIKGISTKRHSTFMEDAAMKGFHNVGDRFYNGYKELYLGEGDSAVSALLAARNSKYQALLGVMGVVDNTFGMTIQQVMQKPVFRNLISILGCGIGDSFDIKKLRFQKIILAFDADVDGSNITSLFLLFFFKFLPEIIYAGKLYRVKAPLYIMDKNSLKRYSYTGREWLFDKYEYYHMYHSIIAKGVDVSLISANNKRIDLKPKQLMKWLDENAEYKLELDNLGKKSACNIKILEVVCYYRFLYGDTPKGEDKFKKEIEKIYPEMIYDKKRHFLSGSYDGDFITLICDELFLKSAVRFKREMDRNETIFLLWRNKSEGGKYYKSTIGEFLTEMRKSITLKINQRLKGLGETEFETLMISCMNPKVRQLYRFVISDAKKTLDDFMLLHGRSEKMRESRRELLDKTQLSYADIDN